MSLIQRPSLFLNRCLQNILKPFSALNVDEIMNEYLMSSTFCTSGSVPISDVRISEASMYFKYRYKIHNICVVILTVKVKRIVQLGRNSLFHVVCLFFQKFLTLMNIDRQVTVGIKLMVFIFFPPTIICDSGRILPCEVAIHNPRRRMHIVLTCE